MHYKKYFFSIVVSLLCFSNLIYGQIPFEKRFWFKHYNTESGLVNNNVMSIDQDQHGFIWIASVYGLNKYDGVSMVTYQHNVNDSTSLSSGRIRKVFIDSKNNIWVVSGSAGLNLYHQESDSFIRFQHDPNDDNSISSNQVRDIFEDKEGRLWVSTKDEGLNQMLDGKFKKISFNGTHQYEVHTIFQDEDDALLLDFKKKGELYKFDPSTEIFEKFVFDNKPGERPPYYGLSFLQFGGMLWIGEPDGGLYGIKNNQVIHHFDLGTITHMIAYSKNELWIALENEGIKSYNITTESFYEIKNNKGDLHSLSTDQINYMFCDKQQIIWIGTYGSGLNKLENLKFNYEISNPFNTNSLSDDRIKALLEDSKGNIWIGTDGGGLNRYNKDGTITHYRKGGAANSLSGDVIMALMEDNDGKIWITTYGGGINILDPSSGKIDHISHKAMCLSIIQDNKGRIWAGETKDILVNINKENYEIYPVKLDSSLTSDRFIPFIFEDSKGYIWVSVTEKGLFKFNDNKLEKVNLGSLNNFTILSIYEDPQATLWLGVEGLGLLRFDPIQLTYESVFEKSNLSNISVVSIEEDNHSNLWLGSNQGLIKFNPETLSIQSYSMYDGLLSNQFSYSSSLKTKSGYLIFGSSNGINYFHPDSISDNLFLPPVVLTSFKIFDKEIAIDKNGSLKSNILLAESVNLHYSESSITIAYSALNHYQSESNKYSYYMSSVDNDWSIPSNQNIKSYTNLQPGRYQFKVKAQNNDGHWGEERTLIINISTPWWEYPVARVTYFFIFLGLVLLFIRIRTSRVNKQKEALSQLVKEQTQGLILANEGLLLNNKEIKAKSDQLKQTLSELKSTQSQLIQSEKMSSIGQLTAGVAHEINNPINFITAGATALAYDINDLMTYIEYSENNNNDSDELKQIKDEIDFDFLIGNIQQTIKDIRQGGERTAEIVKELKTFSRIDKDTFMSADIHQGIESTLVLLQSSIKNNINLIKDYSSSIVEIDCYPGQLNQVFMNLFTNAIQAMNGKGTIKITTKDEGDSISISIKDSGPGIPLEIREKIFDPFFTTKDVGEGTGLGLSISYGIIKKHKGEIELICGKDGCEFIITLPKIQL